MTRAGREVEVVGVVLRVRDFGDSHRVLEALTPTLGRMSLFARGGRASRKRFSGALDLFVTLRMQCIQSRDAWTLRAADVLDARLGLRGSLEQLERATLLLECAALLAVDNEPTPGLYDSLCWALDLVAAGEVDTAMVALPRMVIAAGIGPDASTCVHCRRPTSERAVLAASEGGVLCVDCAGDQPALPVAVLRGEGEKLDAASARVLEAAITPWIENHTGKRLRSRGGPFV